ncbi:hypothetical protein [Metaclostridioides mangenotii]|uniref:hypothetical protein n=1 Tax=Metaclostridioides mangenotii TaxID=1540 RepID=UPI000466D73D|nr:hypothetical protein [Clostridioides mangenotii]
MIIIATRILLVFIGIGALISMFCLGRWSGQMRFYKKHNEIVSKNKRLKRDNEYFRSQLGLNNLTEDDIGKRD